MTTFCVWGRKDYLQTTCCSVPFLGGIYGQKKDHQCWVSNKRVHNYSLGQINRWSNLQNTEKAKIVVPKEEDRLEEENK